MLLGKRLHLLRKFCKQNRKLKNIYAVRIFGRHSFFISFYKKLFTSVFLLKINPETLDALTLPFINTNLLSVILTF